MDRMTSTPETAAGRKPGLRLGLFVPFGLLVLVAALWTAGVLGPGQGGTGDRRLDRPRGRRRRTWTCADRAIGGYPFRLELRCAALRFARSDVAFSVGPVVAVAQVYQPRHVILEAKRAVPRRAGRPDRRRDLDRAGGQPAPCRRRLPARLAGGRRPKGQVIGAVPQPSPSPPTISKLHARPTPGRFEGDGAIDLSTRVARAGVPLLEPDPRRQRAGRHRPRRHGDAGGADGVRTRPLPVEMEAWRAAGGEVELTKLSLAKGDPAGPGRGHRRARSRAPARGRFEVRTAGLEGVVAPLIGAQLGSRLGGNGAALVAASSASSSRRPAPGAGGAGPAGTDESRLRPLPTVRLADGR